jgi:hypothetical protein
MGEDVRPCKKRIFIDHSRRLLDSASHSGVRPMPVFIAILPLLAFVAGQEGAPITVTASPWAPFISPAGEPFRSRSSADDPFARWFGQADRNRDSFLTADEMRADAVRFFAAIDSNRDGKIDSDELLAYEFELAPEVQVNSNWKRTRQSALAERKSDPHGDRSDGKRRGGDNGVDGYQLDGLQGAARYALLNIPEPVAGSDLDLNGKVTLDEFRRSADYRFQLLDTGRQGKLTLRELETLIPSRPNAKRRSKHRDRAIDARIAIPLPEEH